jgi:acyl transferase domain-containing protein/NAD(P)-dependent dehydrogenase (short-subunit alcohol dehydrogenase family)/acyl carrier protein
MAEGIAIIGIGCRFPGGVTNPADFWNFLLSGGDGIVDVPADRWDVRRFYSRHPNAAGKMYMRRGGFLRQPMDHFDPLFFGISPREAGHIDPQQRLLLEVAWEAFEDGGLIPGRLAGTGVGVYVGGFALDSMAIQLSPLNRSNLRTHHLATATSMTMLAARLSYTFDLRGPCISLDTACSSSLVALHYACQDIWSGECPLALAGGVNVMFCPQFPVLMCKGSFLSPDGHCKSFDEEADGYARGEGCGIVVLKPLEAALADRDRIYAVILGTGINHDGHTEGISAPNPEAQEALIRKVYARARVPFHWVDYVEAHGTGTAVGDPIEASVLGHTIGKGRRRGDACLVGSVKANIGHLEAAAGVAGTIKAALCLKNRQVPPQVMVQTPNPNIAFENWGIRLPQGAELLPAKGRPAYVGVNSFGYGGTNAHIVLTEAPQEKTKRSSAEEVAWRGPHILPISARSEVALQELARSYAGVLANAGSEDLGNICYSAATRRSHFECRLAAVGETALAIFRVLTTYLASGRDSRVPGGSKSNREAQPVFVFSGMGPQWWGMGQELLRFSPTFRCAAERCNSLFERIAGWSILAEMGKEESSSRMRETQVAQPANFIVQVALTELLKSWGIRPAAVVGHSVGEVAAAYVSGILDLNEAVRVIFHRSRLQQTTAGTGKMLAIGQSAAAVPALIEGHDHEVSIAAINGPSSVVLSGDATALERIATSLSEQNIFNRMLQVEVPYHSPVMERLQDEMMKALDNLSPHAPTVPNYSTVTGKIVSNDERHTSVYWYRNIRDPVLFGSTIDHLIDDGHNIFLEIGPHPVLTPSIRECLLERGAPGDVINCLRRGESESTQMSLALAKMYALGRSVAWDRVYSGAFSFVPLPNYPWQRESYWSESAASLADRRGVLEHPFVGQRVPAATPLWEADLNTSYASDLTDHVIDDTIVFPAAAYVDAWLAIQEAIDGRKTAILEGIAFDRMVVIDPADDVRLQWSYNEKAREVRTYSRSGHDGSEWIGVASACVLSSDAWAGEHAELELLKGRFVERMNVEDFYESLKRRGLQYGPSFRCIRALWRRGHGQVLARLELDQQQSDELGAYRLHPALLDASFQSLLATADTSGGREIGGLYVPVSVRQIRYHEKLAEAAWCVGTLIEKSTTAIEGNLVLYGETGRVAAEIVGLQCSSIAQGSKDHFELDSSMYTSRWDRTAPVTAFADSGRWIVFVDDGPVASSLARHLRSQGSSEVVEIAPGSSYEAVSTSRFRIRPEQASDFKRICKDADIANARGVAYLWPLNRRQGDADPAGTAGLLSALRLVQSLTSAAAKPPRLYVITRSTRYVHPGDVLDGLSQSPLVGLCQVTASEFPDLRCTLVDLDANDDERIGRTLGAELLANSLEDDVALRAGERFVHRLIRLSRTQQASPAQTLSEHAPDRGFRLELGIPGSVDGLYFRELERRAPGPREVEVRVRAAGLNFKDVIKALGLLSKKAVENTFHAGGLGMEAAAVVTRVGEGVVDYAAGDAIIASLPNSFSSHLTISTESLLAIKGDHGLSPAEAASIPVVFMTAYHALCELAGLSACDTVLIHAAAGGVGLAAIQVAQWRGAEIFATAGSPAKRDYLRNLGITHVWDSRTLAFADKVKEATGGRGIDVVLNSLPGDGVLKSLSVLAPLGRFVEIGKRAIVENSLLPMQHLDGNVSFFTVDLDRMMLERPGKVRRLLEDILELFRSGTFKALPLTVFPAPQTAEAFRFMAQSKQIGKVVIDMEAVDGLELAPSDRKRDFIKPDATYLVTGGFGGAGLELCRVLARRGARHLAIVGRRGATTAQAKQTMEDLRGIGVVVAELQANLSQQSEVRKVLANIAASMPPLRGIFHAAGVVKDAFLPNLDAEAMGTVMGPKALGAWHLHDQTQSLAIDLFVLFSSATALIGNPGQANYVAANVFLDALAHHRRAIGLPALSVNWGALGGSGMVASDRRVAEHLERSGVREIPIDLAMDALFRLLELEPVQLALMDIDWRAWREANPAAAGRPQYSALLSAPHGGADRSPLEAIRQDLERSDPKQRLEWLAAKVADVVARALHLSTEKIDIYQPVSELGIDSLLAAEMQAAIRSKLGVQISAVQLIKGATIVGLARQLLEKMAVPYVEATARRTRAPAPSLDAISAREQVSAE